MFSFATGTGACLASFDFARGLLARSNGESFAPLLWRRCQCELSVLLLLDGFLPSRLRTSSRKKGAVSPTLSAFKLRAERRETCPTLSAFQTLGIPGNVFGRRSTVLLQREVFVDLNDDGQAPESVLFLFFMEKTSGGKRHFFPCRRCEVDHEKTSGTTVVWIRHNRSPTTTVSYNWR